MIVCRLAGVALGIATALALAEPAVAQIGHGAEVTRFDDCYVDELVGTFCSAGPLCSARPMQATDKSAR